VTTEIKILIAVTVSVTVILAALLLLIPYVTYSMAFKRKRSKHPVGELSAEEKAELLTKDIKGEAERASVKGYVKELLELPFEEVSIISRDGLKLCGLLYAPYENAPLEIQLHGYRSNPIHDFSGGGLEVLKGGRNLLMIYQRAHGRSEGRTISFGILERLDVLEWVKFAIERFGSDVKISLVGISMGAATVLLASELDLPENVRYAVADCPYSSIKEIIKKVAGEMGFPPRLVYPFIRLGARIFGGFDPDLRTPLSAAANAKIPVLLIHGKEDGFVPFSMSEDIAKAAKERVHFCAFDGADHGMSYIVNPQGYMAAVNDFKNKYLK